MKRVEGSLTHVLPPHGTQYMVCPKPKEPQASVEGRLQIAAKTATVTIIMLLTLPFRTNGDNIVSISKLGRNCEDSVSQVREGRTNTTPSRTLHKLITRQHST